METGSSSSGASGLVAEAVRTAQDVEPIYGVDGDEKAMAALSIEKTMIEKVTSQDFEDKVLKSDLPIFACFTTSWCRSCFAFCLVTEGLAKEYEGRIKFVEVDAEEAPELTERYNIRALPAVLIFKHSEPVKNLLGFHSRGPLRNLLDALATGNREAT